MNVRIVYIFSSDIDEQHFAWYAIQSATSQEAARTAWTHYKLERNVEFPEEWSITVAYIDITVAGTTLLPLGNFATGWLDVPHQTFGGDTL